jgi:hypothetical protein
MLVPGALLSRCPSVRDRATDFVCATIRPSSRTGLHAGLSALTVVYGRRLLSDQCKRQRTSMAHLRNGRPGALTPAGDETVAMRRVSERVATLRKYGPDRGRFAPACKRAPSATSVEPAADRASARRETYPYRANFGFRSSPRVDQTPDRPPDRGPLMHRRPAVAALAAACRKP